MNSGERGVSSVVGYALLLVIVAFGIVAVVALGGAAVTDIQQSTQAEQASVAMSEFDAKAAQVAIGNGGVQAVSLGRGDGTVSVDEAAGRVTITHVEDTGDTVLANQTLGAVVYDTGGAGSPTRAAASGGPILTVPGWSHRPSITTVARR